MHATIRRYEGVDATRMNEVVGKINETLVPQLRELSGFTGYYLIQADNGIVSSVSLFEGPERQGCRSQRPRPRRRVARPNSVPTRGARHGRAPRART